MSGRPGIPDDEDDEESIQVPLKQAQIDALSRLVWTAFRDPKTTDDDKRLYRAILDTLDATP